jgi:hypothetical protein
LSDEILQHQDACTAFAAARARLSHVMAAEMTLDGCDEHVAELSLSFGDLWSDAPEETIIFEPGSFEPDSFAVTAMVVQKPPVAIKHPPLSVVLTATMADSAVFSAAAPFANIPLKCALDSSAAKHPAAVGTVAKCSTALLGATAFISASAFEAATITFDSAAISETALCFCHSAPMRESIPRLACGSTGTQSHGRSSS